MMAREVNAVAIPPLTLLALGSVGLPRSGVAPAGLFGSLSGERNSQPSFVECFMFGVDGGSFSERDAVAPVLGARLAGRRARAERLVAGIPVRRKGAGQRR